MKVKKKDEEPAEMQGGGCDQSYEDWEVDSGQVL